MDNYDKSKIDKKQEKKYKEFSEERAKRLYEDLILQWSLLLWYWSIFLACVAEKKATTVIITNVITEVDKQLW